MGETKDFYTLKGYSLLENNKITSSMEDYLEMIYRLYQDRKSIRINALAKYLHVKPSSASKMVANLKNLSLVEFERYGTITLTPEGIELGSYLLYRHEILHDFFCFLNQSTDEVTLVEKVEHFIDSRTITNIERFLKNHTTNNTLK